MISIRSLARLTLAVGALAMALPATAGSLSPRLSALAASYRKAAQATVAQAALATAGQAPGIFQPHVTSAGKVQVYIHYLPGALPTPAALASVDATGVLVSRPLGVVQAWVPIGKLEAAAALDGVGHVSLPMYGVVNAVAAPNAATSSCSAVPAGLSIDQEGIAAENIGPLQADGITGAGVKLGVISDGVDCMSVSQAQGYLPNNVWVDSSLPGSGDEGTAMLEEVHAVAPDTSLGFCGFESNGNFTTADFLQCLSDLASWGANIISDDLSFFPVAYNTNFNNGVTSFAQNNPTISLTAAGGNGRAAFFQDDYVATTNPTSPGVSSISLSPTYTVGPNGGASGRSYISAMDFGVATGGSTDAAEKVTIDPGVTLYGDLTWDDPQAGPYDDLDLFLLNSAGKVACSPTSSQYCSSTWDQKDNPSNPSSGSWYPPGEFIDYKNTTSSVQTLYLVVLCFECTAHGSSPLLIKLYGHLDGGGAFDYVTNGGIAGHDALAAELTAGAARYSSLGGDSTIEPYSDTGPYTYGDWLNGLQQRAKPDITGTDGVTVSGAGGFGQPNSGGGATFYGTSAASPNVGAVIALLRSGFPGAESNAAQWKQLVMGSANKKTLTNYTLDSGGTGLVDAEAAATSLSTITATITAPVATSGTAVKEDPNTNVNFNATCDYTGSGSPTLTYKWTFGGNSGIPSSTKLTPDPVQYTNGGIYTVKFNCSDSLASASDQLTVAVQAAATAQGQSISTPYEMETAGQLSGSDIGGEQVHYELVTGASHGTATVNSSGGFSYTPDSGYSGKDSFTFDIDNGVMKSNTATVSITVGPAPSPSGGGGGGAFGGFGLGLLAGLAGLALAVRRRR